MPDFWNDMPKEPIEPVVLQRTSAQLADSIAQLTGRLNKLKEEKKAKAKSYNESIKELEAEIKGEQEQYQQMREMGL